MYLVIGKNYLKTYSVKLCISKIPKIEAISHDSISKFFNLFIIRNGLD